MGLGYWGQGRRPWWLLFVFCFLINNVSVAKSSVEPTCGSRIWRVMKRKIPKKIWVPAVSLMLGLGAGRVTRENWHHDAYAAVTGADHLGYGIYFDWAEMRATFTGEERALVDNPVGNEKEIVRLMTSKLIGDFDNDLIARGSFENHGTGKKLHWYSHDYPGGRSATKFLVGQSGERGICRHKAVILQAALNRIGIKSELKFAQLNGETNGDYFHAFVYVPSLDVVADPSFEFTMDREKYYYLFVSHETDRNGDPK